MVDDSIPSDSMVDDDTLPDSDEEGWVQKWWRPSCAVVYLIICIFDFIIMPVYTAARTERVEIIIEEIAKLPATSQPTALTILGQKQVWKSLTLSEGGLFHLSFGAILGVAAWTRGREKVAKLQQLAVNAALKDK
jgi:hypothetical protein